jgi:hypothetical protein
VHLGFWNQSSSVWNIQFWCITVMMYFMLSELALRCIIWWYGSK